MIDAYSLDRLIRSVVYTTNDLRDTNQDEDRHRYLSLAVTAMEEAENWLYRLQREIEEARREI